MIWTRIDESTRTLLYSVTCLSIVVLALWFGATLNSAAANTGKAKNAVPVATFPANSGTLGAIPDNLPGSPRDVTFTVSGLSGAPSNVEANMTFGGPGLAVGHSWVGDLNVWLIAPNGTSFVVFGRTGQTGANAGDSSDLTGPYTFKDSAMGTNWWAEAFARTSTQVLTSGDYRTTASGPQPVNNTSPATDFSAAFSGVANPNGTWTLRFTDNAGGDTGAVSAANLTIETAAAPSGPVNVDFDGDGKSDYSIVRNQTPPLRSGEGAPAFRFDSIRDRMRYEAENRANKDVPTEPMLAPPPVGNNIGWWISNSGSGTSTGATFGEPTTDFFVPADYDGDGKTDIAVWRPITAGGANENAFFYIFESGTSTLKTVDFGQNGDDAAIVGDYDGDGKADPAVYRCPALGAGDGQCFFYFKGSNNNPGGNTTFIPWGFGETFDFFVNPGDFDGDGRYDFCIQGTDPANANGGIFYLLRSGDFGVEYVRWGRNTDIIVPGDYDGDGKADFAVSRTETINTVAGRSYYILERDGGGTGASPIRWGIAGDNRVPGDYDGDGKTDIAIWRPNADPSMNFFYVRRSSDGMLGTFEWGQQGDAAVAGWNVH